jgi:molybdate transport system substrate-binding protein
MCLPAFLVMLASFATSSPRVMAGDRELLVSAAISLREVMTEAGAAFGEAHPGVHVALNFGASGQLRAQVEAGAPVDVFVAAAAWDLDALEQKGLLAPGSRVELARNSLVLVCPREGGLPLRALSELSQPQVRRAALGNPATVPAGRYARQALEHLGLASPLKERLILAEHVRQVLDWVTRGEVDAGFVYRTDALAEPRVRVVAEVPPQAHEPIVYPAAVLAGSRETAAARAFVEWLASPSGRALFERHGFAAPKAVR